MARLRFQFRLRTLLIGVTLFCVVGGGYIGWQKRTVIQRQRERAWVVGHGGSVAVGITYPNKSHYVPAVSWIRGVLGDRAVAAITFPHPLNSDDEARLKATFPEAAEISGNVIDTSFPATPAFLPR